MKIGSASSRSRARRSRPECRPGSTGCCARATPCRESVAGRAFRSVLSVRPGVLHPRRARQCSRRASSRRWRPPGWNTPQPATSLRRPVKAETVKFRIAGGAKPATAVPHQAREVRGNHIVRLGVVPDRMGRGDEVSCGQDVRPQPRPSCAQAVMAACRLAPSMGRLCAAVVSTPAPSNATRRPRPPRQPPEHPLPAAAATTVLSPLPSAPSSRRRRGPGAAPRPRPAHLPRRRRWTGSAAEPHASGRGGACRPRHQWPRTRRRVRRPPSRRLSARRRAAVGSGRA